MTQMSDALKRSLGILAPEGEETLPTIDNPPSGDYEVDPETGEVLIPAAAVVKLELVAKETVLPTGDDAKSDIISDYVHARNLTYTLLHMTGDALAGSLKLAQETEHPRAYGVFNELAVTMRGLTQDLLALQKAYKEVTKDKPDLQPPPSNGVTNVTQNNINVGGVGPQSTTDIMRFLAENQHLLTPPTNGEVVDVDAYSVNPRQPKAALVALPEPTEQQEQKPDGQVS